MSNSNKNKKEERKENLWKLLLDKASLNSGKGIDEGSTLIVLGDKQNGTGSLMSKFKNRVNQIKAKQKNKIDIVKMKETLLDYSYTKVTNVHDADDPEEVRAHMNVWELDKMDQAEALLPGYMAANGLHNTSFMVTCDLSRPWTVLDRVKKWIDCLSTAHKKVFDQLDEAKQKELKTSISKYNEAFRDVSQNTDENDETIIAPTEVKLDLENPKINLGVPLIIVGCKGDSIESEFQKQALNGTGDRFEYMTRHLRTLAVDYGASLFYTSAAGEGKNIDKLQEYIYHRLYGFEWVHPAKVVGDETDYDILVPSGFDTLDLITSIQPRKSSWEPNAQFDEVFKAPAEEKKAEKVRRDPEIKAEANEVFLKELKFRAETSGVAKRPKSGKKVSEKSFKVSETSSSSGSGSKSAAASLTRTPSKSGKNKDHGAVKDFFRQLLSSSGSTGGKASSANTRQQAKEALGNIKK